MSGQRTNTDGGHVAILERLYQAQRSERSLNRIVDSATHVDDSEDGRSHADRAEDNLFNFLQELGVKEMHALVLRVLNWALWCGWKAPTKEEMQTLWHVDGFGKQLALLVIASGKNMEEAERLLRKAKKGKRIPRGPKMPPVHEAEEDMIQWMGTWGPQNLVKGLRAAERRAAYYTESLPDEERLCDLLLFRAIIDKVGEYADMVDGPLHPKRSAPVAPMATC